MINRSEFIRLVLVIAFYLIIVTIPFVFGIFASNSELIFSGFLFNPLDGYSYLAKMQQGFAGSWMFHLPFTSESSQPAFLFAFYIFLGHVARWFNLSLIVTFHISRLVCTAIFLIVLFNYLKLRLHIPRLYWSAFLISIFGSGMGWLLLPFGKFTSDFWVAEAFPFLSCYANPHFPLSLAFTLILLNTEHISSSAARSYAFNGLISILLAILAPFGIVLSVGILSCQFCLTYIFHKRVEAETIKRVITILVSTLPLLIYYLWIIQQDPLLSIWNTQNITATPPIWDLIVSFSPFILISLPGLYITICRQKLSSIQLAAWMVIALVLVYLPWGLQRRFMMGLYVPLCALAIIAIDRVAAISRRIRIVAILLFILLIPTNLIVMLAGVNGSLHHETSIYIYRTELIGFDFLRTGVDPNAVILASPETSLLIPGYTGHRIVYAHPFETVNAELRKAQVNKFFSGNGNLNDVEFEVDYIWIGPREKRILGTDYQIHGQIVYQNDEVAIYKTSP